MTAPVVSLQNHKPADDRIEFDRIEFDRIQVNQFYRIQVGEFGRIVDSRIRTNKKDHNEKTNTPMEWNNTNQNANDNMYR